VPERTPAPVLENQDRADVLKRASAQPGRTPEGEENRFLLHKGMPEDLACGLIPRGLERTPGRGAADTGPPMTIGEAGPSICGHDDRRHRRTYEDTGPGGPD
jgi:hypothetical protein